MCCGVEQMVRKGCGVDVAVAFARRFIRRVGRQPECVPKLAPRNDATCSVIPCWAGPDFQDLRVTEVALWARIGQGVPFHLNVLRAW